MNHFGKYADGSSRSKKGGGTTCDQGTRVRRSGGSDQRRLIQRKYRLIRRQRAINGYFHQHALEAGGEENRLHHAICARECAAVVLMGNRTALVIVAVFVVMMPIMRILVMAVTRDAVRGAIIHRPVK